MSRIVACGDLHPQSLGISQQLPLAGLLRIRWLLAHLLGPPKLLVDVVQGGCQLVDAAVGVAHFAL
jgi:hypothetical protein